MKISLYKDREKVLKAYRKTRKSLNNDNAQAAGATADPVEGEDRADERKDIRRVICVIVDFSRVSYKARSHS